MSKTKPVRGWVGLVNDGKLDLEPMGGYGVVYRTRREARSHVEAQADTADRVGLDTPRAASSAIPPAASAPSSTEAPEPEFERKTGYNAGLMMKLQDEILGPIELERLHKAPQWYRSVVNDLVKRIYQHRVAASSATLTTDSQRIDQLERELAQAKEAFNMIAKEGLKRADEADSLRSSIATPEGQEMERLRLGWIVRENEIARLKKELASALSSIAATGDPVPLITRLDAALCGVRREGGIYVSPGLLKDCREALAQPSATLPTWRPVSEKPEDEERLFVVRDTDGQCAFAVRYNGAWEHTADADCGPIAEWFPLPPSASTDGSAAP